MLKVELKMACFWSIAIAKTTILPEGRTVLVEELDWLSVIYFLFTIYGIILSWFGHILLGYCRRKLVDYWRVRILASFHGKSKNCCQSERLSCIFCIWKDTVCWREVDSKLLNSYAWHEVVRIVNRKADFNRQYSLIKAWVDILKPEPKGNVIETNDSCCVVIVSKSARIWKNISINWRIIYFFI